MSQAALERYVRVAARALARHGLVQAWGHCSARIDERHFLVCAAQPMGSIGLQSGTVVSIDEPLPPGVLGEVRIHQQVYARRSEVGGICRIMPHYTMALSTLGQVPSPRHGVGAFTADCRYWNDPRLLRDDGLAKQLAETLGEANALVMRANGAVTVGPTLDVAVGIAWCLEDAARIECTHRSMIQDVNAGLLSPDEVRARQVSTGQVFERLWTHLTFGDQEHADPAADWRQVVQTD